MPKGARGALSATLEIVAAIYCFNQDSIPVFFWLILANFVTELRHGSSTDQAEASAKAANRALLGELLCSLCAWRCAW